MILFTFLKYAFYTYCTIYALYSTFYILQRCYVVHKFKHFLGYKDCLLSNMPMPIKVLWIFLVASVITHYNTLLMVMLVLPVIYYIAKLRYKKKLRKPEWKPFLYLHFTAYIMFILIIKELGIVYVPITIASIIHAVLDAIVLGLVGTAIFVLACLLFMFSVTVFQSLFGPKYKRRDIKVTQDQTLLRNVTMISDDHFATKQERDVNRRERAVRNILQYIKETNHMSDYKYALYHVYQHLVDQTTFEYNDAHLSLPDAPDILHIEAIDEQNIKVLESYQTSEEVKQLLKRLFKDERPLIDRDINNIKPDLDSIILNNIEFNDYNFRHTDFSHSAFYKVNFIDTSLRNVDLSYTKINTCEFRGNLFKDIQVNGSTTFNNDILENNIFACFDYTHDKITHTNVNVLYKIVDLFKDNLDNNYFALYDDELLYGQIIVYLKNYKLEAKLLTAAQLKNLKNPHLHQVLELDNIRVYKLRKTK